MPFKKYKETHGGRGPMENLYASVTGGEGIFGSYGLRQERELTDQLIADVSSQDEFRGLAGMLEVGRSPLTREQHADFRSSVLQAALDTRVFNAGMGDYAQRSKAARGQLASAEDALILDNMDAMAAHAQRLAAAGRGDKAQEVFGAVMQNFGAFIERNEQQRLEVESAQAAGRDTKRELFQTVYNQQVLGPTMQTEADYTSIAKQLENGKPDEIAPNSVISAMFQFAGAQLRGSDDGNWSFSLGPVGLSDAAVPTMTYSQVRNQLNAARDGRMEVLNRLTSGLTENATRQGFGINGSSVDDLLFPLASAQFKSRETEFKPPSMIPDMSTTGEAQPTGVETPQAVIKDTLIGLGDIYQYARSNWRDQFEYLLGRKPEELPPPPPPPTPGDRRPGNRRRGRGSVSGVIQRPTND